jgi:hypothetical protein
LKKDSEEPDSISLLVVGTENGGIYILPPDPAGSAYLCKIQLQSTPVMMNVSGLFDTEWRYDSLSHFPIQELSRSSPNPFLGLFPQSF